MAGACSFIFHHLYRGMYFTRTLIRIAFISAVSALSIEGVAAQASLPDTIPFNPAASQNNILLPVILNGADTLMLMFHSSYSGVSLTEEGLAKCRTVHPDQEGSAESWAGTASTPLSQNNVVRIGSRTWDKLMITVDKQSGEGSDGKFGYDLFADRVLEIDRTSGSFIVHPSLPRQAEAHRALPLVVQDNGLFVQASVSLMDSSYTDLFMVHTGFGGTCILGTDLMTRVDPTTRLDTLGLQELSDSFGNVLRNIITRTPLLTLGKSQFRDVRIQVMDKRSHFGANVLGNELLRSFTMWIDVRNSALYLATTDN